MQQIVSESIVRRAEAGRGRPLSGPLPILVENLGKRAVEWAAGRLQPQPKPNASRPN